MTRPTEHDLLAYTAAEDEYALRQLHHWLKYEGLLPFAGVGAFVIPYGLIMTALVAAAVLFAPYMLFQLWRARWVKTIVLFVVLVLVPVATSYLIESDDVIITYFLRYLPLVAFYLFAWILRLVIGEELNERSAVRLFDHERARNSE